MFAKDDKIGPVAEEFIKFLAHKNYNTVDVLPFFN